MKKEFKKLLEKKRIDKKLSKKRDYYLNLFYKKILLRRDRKFILNYIAQGLKNGSSFKELIYSISIDLKNKRLKQVLSDIIFQMEEHGLSDMEAMYEVGFIDEIELNTIKGISKTEAYKAYEFILNRSTNQDNLKWGIGMLFVPILLVLTGYVIFQPELKALTENILLPINNLSLEKIAIPEYFNDRNTFIYGIMIVISIMGGLYLLVEYLKRNNPKLLFKIFRIYEREFMINNLSIFSSLIKSGESPIKAIEVLANNKQDILSSTIFNKIKEHQKEGDMSIHSIFKEYGIDNATIAYIRSGEDNNALEKGLKIALQYNTERYKRLTKLLTKILPLIGEILMSLAILIPIVDIIIVTTVGTMQFQI